MSCMSIGRRTATMFSGLGLALFSAACLAASEPDDGGFIDPATVPGIQILSYSGTGCAPADTAASPGIGADPFYAQTLIMSDFVNKQNVSEVDPDVLTRECTIRFKVRSPDGKPYDVTAFMFHGYTDMTDPSGRGTVSFTYGVEGRPPVVATTRLVPNTMDVFDGYFRVPRSRCGVNDVHQLKIVTRLAPSPRSEYFVIDTVEFDANPRQFNRCYQ